MPDWTTNHDHADCRKPGITRSSIARWVPPRHRGRGLFHHAPARMRLGSPSACPMSRVVAEVPHLPPAHTSERPRPCHAAHQLGMHPTHSGQPNHNLMVRTAIAVLTISRPLCPHRTRACALLRQVHHQGKHGEQVRVVVPQSIQGAPPSAASAFCPCLPPLALPPSTPMPPPPSLPSRYCFCAAVCCCCCCDAACCRCHCRCHRQAPQGPGRRWAALRAWACQRAGGLCSLPPRTHSACPLSTRRPCNPHR